MNQAEQSGGSHRPAGALNAFAAPSRHPLLAWASTRDLVVELLARLAAGETVTADGDLVVAGQLHDVLGTAIDVHLNRFSRQRLIDTTHQFFWHYPPAAFEGSTVVDLGCGSLNPYTLGFLFLLLGAKRAYAVDLEPIQDQQRAARVLSQVAAWMLIDSTRLIGQPVATSDVAARLQAFDVSRLERGDIGGIPEGRLTHLLESTEQLSLADGEADLLTSVSLLEHVADIDTTLASLRRVTAPGGRGHHVVDFVDHRLYGGQTSDPFAFLTLESSEPLMFGSNRLRLGQLHAAFERQGFDVERVIPCRTDPITDAQRSTFVEPYRSMSLAELGTTCARFFVRRR